MYSIKKVPEDFKVFENSSITPKDEGRYTYFRLKKTDYTTIKAIQRIADFLRIKLKDIGYAGNKDKHAVTIQTISIKGEHSLKNFVDDNIKIEYLGKGDNPVTLGDLKSNTFEINVYSEIEPKPITQTINYFDEQRFSTNNVDIGLAIAKGDFKTATTLINQPCVAEYLKDHQNDFVGAVKTLPFKILSLYLHALSGMIFNNTTSKYLQCKYECKTSEYSRGTMAFPQTNIENIKIPIVGYATVYENKEIKEITRSILKELDIKERSFIIKAIPELSNEGDERNLITEIKDLEIKKIEEEKTKVKFSLPKGCYATIVIRNLFL